MHPAQTSHTYTHVCADACIQTAAHLQTAIPDWYACRYNESVLSFFFRFSASFFFRFNNTYSCRPKAMYHLEGSLNIGAKRALLQTAAFVFIYILKLAFEYYAVCKPLVVPVSLFPGFHTSHGRCLVCVLLTRLA